MAIDLHPRFSAPRTLSVVKIFAGAALLAVAFAGTPAVAQITPSHVYQVVDTINAELAAMHQANASQPRFDDSAPVLTPRRPRHVVQKAREVLLKVQMLRVLNGLPENPVPDYPTRELTPSDSKLMVDAILRDLRDLRAKFNVAGEPAPAALQSDRTPTDVYANLQKASDQLDGLGIPKTVPNDVYRLAIMIVDDLEKIRTVRGKTTPIPVPADVPGKKPLDTYSRVFEILESLKAKVDADPSLKLADGVVLPNRRTGAINPSHVLDLENNLLAELGALKVGLGIASTTVLPKPQEGKTPTHTYSLLSQALLQVNSL